MFQVIAVPFEAHRQLPSPQHRWLMTCLTRYADRGGKCWPTMRQLAADARMSLSTVQRRLAEMARLGCFTRARKGVGRYVYQLAEAYIPRWPGRVSPVGHGVSQRVTQEVNQQKQIKRPKCEDQNDGQTHDDLKKWEPRLRGWHRSRFWLPFWGPNPSEPGCWAPTTSPPASGIPRSGSAPCEVSPWERRTP